MTDEKRDRVAAELRKDAGQADRRIARACGVSPTYVGKVRSEMEQAGEIERPVLRQGGDKRRRKVPDRRREPTPEERFTDFALALVREGAVREMIGGGVGQEQARRMAAEMDVASGLDEESWRQFMRLALE